MRLDGRAAIVTGGSRGIGFAVAQGLLASGADVLLTARDGTGVEEAVERLRAGGGSGERRGRVEGRTGSAGDPDATDRWVRGCLELFGSVDFVVNNAGANQPLAPAVSGDPAVWLDTFAVNVHGPLALVRAAWQVWMREHGGAVVNVVTEGVHGAGPGLAAYETSKAALLQLTRHLAAELAPGGAGQLGLPRPGAHRTGPALLGAGRAATGLRHPDAASGRAGGHRFGRGLAALPRRRLGHRHRPAGRRRPQGRPAALSSGTVSVG